MGWFENRLRPKIVASPWRRDLLALAVLVVLAGTLLPGWVARIGPLYSADPHAQDTAQVGNIAQYLSDIPGQMASFYLPLAMGFALALRCGAVDLSIWAVAGAGGVLAARLMNLGAPVPAPLRRRPRRGAYGEPFRAVVTARVTCPASW